MSARDGRSVGELLLHADTATRDLLFDVTGEDAPAMLRTWGEVVQDAAELWQALPARPRGGTAGGQLMVQLEAIVQRMHRTQLRQGWPGAGTRSGCCPWPSRSGRRVTWSALTRARRGRLGRSR